MGRSFAYNVRYRAQIRRGCPTPRKADLPERGQSARSGCGRCRKGFPKAVFGYRQQKDRGTADSLNIPPGDPAKKGISAADPREIFPTASVAFPFRDKRLHTKEPQPTNQKVGSSNLSGRASETEKGPSQGALFRFTGSTRSGLRPPDVVRRSTTARPRGRTLPIRGNGAHRQRPQRGAAERSGGAISPGAPAGTSFLCSLPGTSGTPGGLTGSTGIHQVSDHERMTKPGGTHE